MNKKGQVLGLSFGVIFSILLIIFFIVIAFYVVNGFLGSKKCVEIGLFLDDFQPEVDKVWNSQRSSVEFSRILPSNIEFICFGNLSASMVGEFRDIGREIGVYDENKNMFFYPVESACNIPAHSIKHIDIDSIVSKNNPNCFEVVDGRVRFSLEKDFNEGLVSIE